MKIWKRVEGKWTTTAVIKTSSPATAVDFSPVDTEQMYVPTNIKERKTDGSHLDENWLWVMKMVPSKFTAIALPTPVVGSSILRLTRGTCDNASSLSGRSFKYITSV